MTSLQHATVGEALVKVTANLQYQIENTGLKTFRVALPGTTATRAATEPVSVADAPTRVREVLIIDDEERLRVTIGRMLSSEHSVTLTSCVEDALALIVGGKRFDLIVSDLMMPQITGMELYRELLRIAPDQARKLAFMTGGAFTDEARRFLDEVPNCWIEKPFDISQLRQLIRTLTQPGDTTHGMWTAT